MSIIKNTASQFLYAVLVSSVDGSAITSGATLSLAKDGGAGAAAGAVLTHRTGGLWEAALTQADTNANLIGYVWGGTNVVPQGGEIVTVEYGRGVLTGNVPQTGDAFARIGANGAGLTALGDARIANLDATVSSRSTYAGTDTAGTTTLLSRLTSTRAGLLDNLDAAITSRLAAINYTAPANADLTTLLGRLSASRAALLDNLSQLDAAVSSRLATAGYTAPSAAPTAAAIRAEIDSNSTKLDVAVSSRLAGASYVAPTAAPSASDNAAAVRTNLATELSRIDVAVSSRNATAPDNAGIGAIKAKTDQLVFAGGAVNANATVDLTGIEVPAPDLGDIEEDLAVIKARFDAVPAGPAAVIPAATDPAQTVAYGTTRDAGGTAQGNIAVEIELVSTPASGFYAQKLTPKSNSAGQVTVTLQRLASYKVRRGAGSWKSFTTTDTGTYALPSLIEGV